MLTPWAAFIICCGCVGGFIGMVVGLVLYLCGYRLV